MGNKHFNIEVKQNYAVNNDVHDLEHRKATEDLVDEEANIVVGITAQMVIENDIGKAVVVKVT